ncbi:conserved hypothetical protein [Ricinus communis]|uniref:DUF7731 domain-containing protein n=1 Tax=Ricinus communis TaxID=3988 RepID=B9RZM1_RICCO|nr:conserved hypothetical protein [Ricinus communis]
MTISVTIRPLKSLTGNAYDEDVPQTGADSFGYEPYTGAGGLGGVSQTGAGVVGDDPAEIVAKALLCFNERHIYSSCSDAYRLTQSGNLNVPPDYVDEYCSGPCLTETHLVLNCIENIMTRFIFYNKATIHDIRDTIKAGCGYGPERGDFNVAEHLQYEENSAYMTKIQNLSGLLGFAIIVQIDKLMCNFCLVL